MEPVPMPDVLNPDRIVMPDGDDLTSQDLAERIGLLRGELRRTCDYGQSLWNLLQQVREYLVAALPPEPGGGTSPTGPDDVAGWAEWTAMCGAVTSSLAGPRGDSGFGIEEAQVIAQSRRG